MLDESQLFGQSFFRVRPPFRSGRVALFETGPAQLGERLRGRCFVRAAEIGERVAQVPGEVEGGAALRDDQSIGDGSWEIGEKA